MLDIAMPPNLNLFSNNIARMQTICLFILWHPNETVILILDYAYF